MKADLADMQKKADLKKELLASKINFGKDKTDYDTTYKTEHDDKGYCKDFGKSLEIMKDLRATHYQLGYQNVSWSNEASTEYPLSDRFLGHKGQTFELGPSTGQGFEESPFNIRN